MGNGSGSRSLTEGSVGRVLIRFSLPVLLANLIQSVYNSINILFLGRFASPAALAGAGNGMSLIYTATGFSIGLMNGGAILLGQYFGARKDRDAARAVGSIAGLLVISAIIVTGLILLFGPMFLRIIAIPPEAEPEAWQYMRICAWGLVFTMGYTAISAVLRALGNSKAPLAFISVSCVLHIILDYIFIRTLDLRAAGAAWATVVAQAASFALALLYLFKTKLPFRFSPRDLKPDAATMVHILKLGVPISLQTVLNAVSFAVIAAVINKMGVSASAANGIVNNIISFYLIIPFAFTAAISAVSAQNIGAGKPERALRSAKLGILLSLIIAVPATLYCNFFPGPVVSLFTGDAGVVRDSALFLIPFSWDCVFTSFVFCLNGFFNGCGLTGFVALHETAAAFLVRIPLSWAMSLKPGATLFHIGIGTPAATAASLVMCLVYYQIKLSGGKLLNLKVNN